jgi:O-antigen/teichoic acid export membrane protein
MRESARAQITAFQADSLFRTATPLLINTVATAVLGILYWIVAARLYSPDDLAIASAAIAAMLTLSGIAQLNLGLGLGVLLPRAGRAAGRLLVEAYAAVTVVGIGLVIVFLLLILPFVDSMRPMMTNPAIVLVFVLGVLFYNLFALQDSALTALRAAHWVPVENVLFGIAKIVVVVVLAAALPHTGIFISWAAPAAVAVIPVTWLLFRLVRNLKDTPPVGAVSLRQAFKPASADYAGYLLLAISTDALPVFAVILLGDARAAVFAVAWLTSIRLDVLAANIGVALTVEGSHGGTLASLRRSALTRGLPMVAGVSLAVIIVAPWLLALYGGEYSEQGTTLLRVLVLAAVPRALTVFAMAAARVQGNMRAIVRLQAISCVLVLGGSVLFTQWWGLMGIGIAWAVAQFVTALAALPTLFGTDRRVPEVVATP